ncbi:MAG: zinc ribbon domain-containing protein [Ignavibacteria bacterium]|nr:zinc ribbon domain-containing protein [Ignavibacteria bacterium]
MPLYEYHCLDCDKIFSIQLSIEEHDKSEAPACPHCGSKKVKQHFSSVSVVTSKKS